MSEKLVERQIGRYLVGSAQELSSAVYSQLTSLFVKLENVRRGGVVGPQGITRQFVEGLGRVVVKHYRRGGLFRFLSQATYMHIGQYRSQHEYQMLLTVREMGVSAPEPIAYAVEGGFLYRTWLVLSEIESVTALADIDVSKDSARFESAMDKLVIQVERLIENRVFHIDLHPGNVVVDSSGQLFILDFDKASLFTGDLNDLRDRYLRRWRRSVIKHGLREEFSELFCARLRKRFTTCQTVESSQS